MMKHIHSIRKVVGAGTMLAIIHISAFAQTSGDSETETSPPVNDTQPVPFHRHPDLAPAPANDDPNWPRIIKKLMDDLRMDHEDSVPFTPPSEGEGPPVRAVTVRGTSHGIDFRVYMAEVHQSNSRYPNYPNPSGYMSRFIFGGRLKDFGTYVDQGEGEPLYYTTAPEYRYPYDWVSVRADLLDMAADGLPPGRYTLHGFFRTTSYRFRLGQYAVDAPYFACLIMNMDSDEDGVQDAVDDWEAIAFVICYRGYSRAVVYHTDEDWPNPYYVKANVLLARGDFDRSWIRGFEPNPNLSPLFAVVNAAGDNAYRVRPPWTHVRSGHREGDPGLPYWEGSGFSPNGHLLGATDAYMQERNRADDLQSQVQALQQEVKALEAANQSSD